MEAFGSDRPRCSLILLSGLCVLCPDPEFNSEMDALISDVQALCEFSNTQKQLGTNYTPTRSRAASSAGGENIKDHKERHALKHVSNGGGGGSSMTLPTPVGPHTSDKQKEFIWRDSQLTTMFRTSSDIKTIYNMFAAILILFAMKVAINDAFNARLTPESFKASIYVLINAFGKTTLVIPFWISLFLVHCLILPIMWMWRTRMINDAIYTSLYVLHQFVFVFSYAFIIIHLDLPVASSLILLCEQVRMVMKSHSFWRETMRIRHHPSETPRRVNIHLSNSEINSTLITNFRDQFNQFMLFHFVPTLIYRNSYPRTRYIRWKFVGGCFAECAGCIFYLYIIFANFCVPEFQATASNPGDLQMLFVSLFNSVIPGIAVYLLTFFGLLHCWMNMFAELTRFADRLFYLDWSAAIIACAHFANGYFDLQKLTSTFICAALLLSASGGIPPVSVRTIASGI